MAMTKKSSMDYRFQRAGMVESRQNEFIWITALPALNQQISDCKGSKSGGTADFVQNRPGRQAWIIRPELIQLWINSGFFYGGQNGDQYGIIHKVS